MNENSVTPVAARMAGDLGVDISNLNGSGHGGRVTKADVISADAGPLEWLRQMIAVRRFEEAAGQGYNRAHIGGFLHLGIGEEACIVGSCAAMQAEDYLFCTYRSHGHALARGTEPKLVMAELYGRQAGTSAGRGGSMHIFDAERRFMGGYGIVGGNIPLAAGLALAVKRRGEEAAVLCQFGDGAANTGNFSETLNMASLWNLPIVFMISNNGFGMGTRLDRHASHTDLSQRGEPYDIEGSQVDGMDVEKVKEAVEAALLIARSQSRPAILEAITYRFRGHSAADPEQYRSKDEVEEWKKRDPIKLYAASLMERDLLSQQQLEGIELSAQDQVDQAVEFALHSPEPEAHTLQDNVYVDTANTAGALETIR